MSALETLVGLDERSERFEEFLRTVGPYRIDTEIDEHVTYYCCEEAGLELAACVKTRRVTILVAYAAGETPDYAPFTGPLPCGLSFGTTVDEVRGRLGVRAEVTNEGLRLPGPEYTLTTRFDKQRRLCLVGLFT